MRPWGPAVAEPLVALQVRGHPLAEARSVPGPSRYGVLRRALVVHALLDAERAWAAGVVLEVVDGAVVSERLVAGSRWSRAELGDRAPTLSTQCGPGGDYRPRVAEQWRVGRLLRQLGYRLGAAVVAADPAEVLGGLAQDWPRADKMPAAWSLLLPGLADEDGKKYGDAPRVLAEPRDGAVTLSWGSISKVAGQERPPQPGPFVSAMQLGRALLGETRGMRTWALVDMADKWGVELPNPPELGGGELGRLRSEAYGIVELYGRLCDELDRLDLGVGVELGSAGGVASALLRAGGVGPLAPKLAGVEPRHLGAAASAFHGGWVGAQVLATPVPAAKVDRASAYLRAASAVGAQSFLVAERIEAGPDDEAADLLAELAQGSRPVTSADVGRLGAALVRVVPSGHLAWVSVVRGKEGRLELAPAHLPDGTWSWALDALGAAMLDGGLAPIAEAVRFRPVGRQDGLGEVRLPGGTTVSWVTDDLAAAMVADRATVRADEALPVWQRDQRAGLAKGAAVALWFGTLARLDVEQAFVTVEDRVLGPEGAELTRRAKSVERPGPWTWLGLAGMVTAAARFELARLVAEVHRRGGTVLSTLTDCALLPMTHAAEPELVPCTGGPHRLPDGGEAIRALPRAEVEGMLAALDDDLPGPAWKREAGFHRPALAVVLGTGRYAMLGAETLDAIVASEAGLGGLFRDPTPEAPRDTKGRAAWAVAGTVAAARAVVTGQPVAAPAWASRPKLRTGRADRPAEAERLATVVPGPVRPFTPYLTAGAPPFGRAVSVDGGASWWGLDAGDFGVGEGVELLATDDEPLSELADELGVEPVIAGALGDLLQPDRRRAPGVQPVAPVRSTASLLRVVGRQGSALLAGRFAPLTRAVDELATFGGDELPAALVEEARQLDGPALARAAHLPLRTAQAFLAGRPLAPANRDRLRKAALRGKLEPTGPVRRMPRKRRCPRCSETLRVEGVEFRCPSKWCGWWAGPCSDCGIELHGRRDYFTRQDGRLMCGCLVRALKARLEEQAKAARPPTGYCPRCKEWADEDGWCLCPGSGPERQAAS